MALEQNYISRTAAVAAGAWITSVVLMLAAWAMVLWPGEMRPRGLVAVTGMTALMTTGVAMVCHIRLYVIRTCCLIRAVAGIELERDPNLHAVR